MSLTRTSRRMLAAVAAAAAVTSILSVPCRSSRADTEQVEDYVLLRWTAPGDDGLNGRAMRYDLRYSTNNIAGTDTLGWWNAATMVNLWSKVPAAPGQPDSVRVLGLVSGLRYYAMIRACDEVPNWSRFSNLAIIQATDITAPKAVVDLRVH